METLIDIAKAPGAQPATIRIPELEPGVGCGPESYLLLPDHSLDERIAAARHQLGKEIVILGHHYQRDEVIKFADFTGDSFRLSQQAAATDARHIIFCGVHFMAESADVLRQSHQQVILPDLAAGCSMADMAEAGDVETCWDELSELGDLGVIPVTYMNSAAAIKALAGKRHGAVCTSSNAGKIVRWAFTHGRRILFLPDEHLGRNTGLALGIPPEEMVVWDPKRRLGGNSPEAIRASRMILWKGYCSVHQRFDPSHIARAREMYPDIRVIVHPECRHEVVAMADEVGSTEQIVARIAASDPGAEWAVGTEIHLVNRLAKRYPDRRILSLDPNVCVCTTMFRISPQHLLWTLDNLLAGRVVNRIAVADETRDWARVALERMMSLG